MRRREVAGSLAVIAISRGLCGPAAAQAKSRLYRVGYFGVTPTDTLFRRFRSGLEDLGYVEGRNVELIYVRYLQGDPDSLDDIAAKLVAAGPDVIVSGTTAPSKALQRLTSTIPIVMVTVSDAADSGLIKTVSRPGGNFTGFETNLSLVVSKQLEMLKELSSRIRRIGLVLNVETTVASKLAHHAASWAQQLGLAAVTLAVTKPSDYDTMFTASKSQGPIDAALIVPDGMAFSHRERIATAASRYGLPTMASYRDEAVAGAMAAYGPNIQDLYRRAATYVDKILKGAAPASLPVEYPSRYQLVINLQTAAALGVAIPPSLLARADEVIE